MAEEESDAKMIEKLIEKKIIKEIKCSYLFAENRVLVFEILRLF